MPLKRCVLREIRSTDRFYAELARQLDLPAHFGGNLDALWDSLTGDLLGPAEVVWEDAASARAALGDVEFETLAETLRAVSDERSDFRFILA